MRGTATKITIRYDLILFTGLSSVKINALPWNIVHGELIAKLQIPAVFVSQRTRNEIETYDPPAMRICITLPRIAAARHATSLFDIFNCADN